MSYQVLARKWRPRGFGEVIGQSHVLRALTNALDSQRLHHAYLFTGTRGVGKTTLGRVFAKALNCETGISSSPCGACASCTEIDEGRCVDLIEVDAASRTRVDETRELLENVVYAPTRCRFKVYLIDEVHMFSTHSFNALLKTLEEPPPHVKFLLATTDPKKLPVTILSRCLQFNLKRIATDSLSEHLRAIVDAEQVAAEEAALHLLAVAADGSARDALSLLDQAIAYGDGKLSETDVVAMLGTVGMNDVAGFVRALADNDGAALIGLARKIAEDAPDYEYVLGELLSFLRRIAVLQALGEEGDMLDESNDVIELAAHVSPEDCQLFYQIAMIGARDLSLAPDPQSGFEMVLLRMLAFRPARSDSEPQSVPSTGEAPQVSDVSTSRDHDAPTGAAATSTPTAGTQQALAPDVDWNKLVAKLELHGLVRELAYNVALVAADERHFELALAREHENLSAERLVKGLASALREQLGLDVIIRLSIERQAALDTPSKRRSEAELARQRAAEKEIVGDPTVQSLQTQFGAVIERIEPA